MLDGLAAIVVAVVAFVGGVPAFAQTLIPVEPSGSWYIGGEAGWTHLADEPAKAIIPVYGPRSDNETWDNGFALGVRAGYRWGPWRLEEEFRTQRNDTATFSGATADGEAIAYALMTNVLYDFPAFDRWTMHVGAGVGAVILHEQIKTAGFANGVIAGTDAEFGYQAIGGVEYPLSPIVAIDFDYRYLATAEPRLRTPPGFVDGGQPAGNLPAGTGYHAHSVIASLIYRFE
ncbi:MAG TPA: porin family protein [Stellaceae bacterium]